MPKRRAFQSLCESPGSTGVQGVRKVSFESNDSSSVRSESESSPVAHGTAPKWKSRPSRTDLHYDTMSDSDDAQTTFSFDSDESEASETSYLGPLGDGVIRPPNMPLRLRSLATKLEQMLGMQATLVPHRPT